MDGDHGPAEAVANLRAMVEAITRPLVAKHVGVVVGASIGPTRVVSGFAGRGQAKPRGDAVFQIGSITKVFTALALADAVTSGELSMDTPLASLLPTSSHPNASAITLGQLASHTSGLPRLPPGLRRQARATPADPYSNFSTADLEAALAAARPRPAPGKRVRYSNFGAALLGEALSRHDGTPFEQVIYNRVTAPLGLPETHIQRRPEFGDRYIQAHSRGRRPVPDWDLGAMPGAGALRSTAHDLLEFAHQNLVPGDSRKPEALITAQQPRAKANRWVQVGLGWHLSPLRATPHTVLWHNGATAGSTSYLGLLPELEAAVVVLSNAGRTVDALGVRLLVGIEKTLRLS
jgi:D-alanyl-D-alanine-carboxypeptidase/D-alanyl-D-alanine-endopeptidase